MSLKVGDPLPEVSLLNQDNELIHTQNFIGQNLVIFFYPKDDSPVCTAEACAFESGYEEFKSLNAEVIGISADSPASHKAFASKHGLTFNLLSDPNREAEQLFGVKRNLFGLLPGRITFIFDHEGILSQSVQSQFDGKKHMKEALKAIKNSQ